MVATSSAIDADERSSSSANRDTANEPIRPSAGLRLVARSGADLEIDGPRKGVGHRRPLLDVGHQRIDIAFRNALAFHVDLDAHVGEADRLLADVAGAPHRGDVEIAFELELELVDDPAAVDRVGMQADGKA